MSIYLRPIGVTRYGGRYVEAGIWDNERILRRGVPVTIRTKCQERREADEASPRLSISLHGFALSIRNYSQKLATISGQVATRIQK